MLTALATILALSLSLLGTSSNAAPTTSFTNRATSPNEWVWIPVSGTMCSDGSVTGFAMNASPSSTDVLINFQDGGLCYDYNSCYVAKKAFNIGTPYNATTFANEGRADTLSSYSLTARFTSDNPFYQANMAWIPYCTGDLHAGNASPVYPPNTAPTYHNGYNNGLLIMQAIKAALPNTQRVWVTGSSAGGFGAVYQYPNAVNVFGSSIRIDLISDSAIGKGNAAWYPSLNIQLPSKSFCPNCDYTRFDSFLPAYANARSSKSRFAALSFFIDTVLPAYQGVSTASLTAELLSDFSTLNLAGNSKGFISRGAGHIVFSSPTTPSLFGSSLSTFMKGMVNSATWTGVS